MSNFLMCRRLTLGILGGLCFLSELILPSAGTMISHPHQSNSRLDTSIRYNHIALSWSDIWHKLKRKKVAGGSRSGMNNLCLVAPNGLVHLESADTSTKDRIEIWHQNPLFVWRSGELNKIVLKNGTDIYWEKEIDNSSSHLFYDGKPLQIGETYKLVVFAPFETEVYSLQVVASDRHQQIQADLAEKQLEAKGATQEEIALAKATYFIEKQMWSDVLWELYSIPHPTGELKKTLEQVNNHNFCS